MNPLVQNSNSLVEDLRRLSQLKDNPSQDNKNAEEANKHNSSYLKQRNRKEKSNGDIIHVRQKRI